MKKNIKGILLILSLLLILTACGKEDVVEQNKIDDNVEVSDYHTVKDMVGREVELKKEIDKIAITPIPWASLVYAVDGSSERIVSMNPSAKKAYEISILEEIDENFKNIDSEIISKDFTINMEEMANLDPDVVIVWDYQEEEIKKLESLNIPVVAIKYSNLETLKEGISLIGQILGKEDKANKLISYHDEISSYLDEKMLEVNERPRALYLRNKELRAFGPGSVNEIFFNKSGGENVLLGEDKNVDLTMEEIINLDPEIIYLSNFDDFTPEDLYQNNFEGQLWDNISAIKNKKVYKTPIGIYRWDAPCAESPIMMMWMAKVQQKDIFKDLDLDEHIIEFYKDFFEYELTEEQVDKILNKKINTDIETR